MTQPSNPYSDGDFTPLRQLLKTALRSCLPDASPDFLRLGEVWDALAGEGLRHDAQPAFLLAYHAGLREAETVVDLGAGCGVNSLILAFRNPNLRLVGVGIQRLCRAGGGRRRQPWPSRNKNRFAVDYLSRTRYLYA